MERAEIMNVFSGKGKTDWRFIRVRLRNDWLLYALLLPVLVWYAVFCYLPMGGVTLAFPELPL